MNEKNQNNINKANLIEKVTNEIAGLNSDQLADLNNCALKNMLLVSVIRNSLKDNRH